MENMFDTYDLPRTRRFSSEIVQLDAPRRNIPGARIKRKSLHARLRVLAQKARNVAGDVSIGQYDVQAQCVVRQWYVSGSMQISTRLSHSPYDVDVVIDLPEGQRVFCEVKAAPNPIPEDLGARIKRIFMRSVPKRLNSFLGKVESIADDTAVVTLLNENTGERIESSCSVDVLVEKGIREGDEFRCEVFQEHNSTTVKFTRLHPKPISKDRVAEIRKEFESRWD